MGKAQIQKRTDHGRRAHRTDKAVRKVEQRSRDPRWTEAMDATRDAQATLDEIIAAQKANPAIGETPGAVYARRQAELRLESAKVIEDEFANEELRIEEATKFTVVRPLNRPPRAVEVEVECDRVYVKQTHIIDTRELPQTGDGNWRFSYQTARIMLKEGYNIKRVIEYTGIGYDDLADIPIDSEGYVIREDDSANAEA
jgi:hypothetical protein